MLVFKPAIHGTGYPLPSEYDELLVYNDESSGLVTSAKSENHTAILFFLCAPFGNAQDRLRGGEIK